MKPEQDLATTAIGLMLVVAALLGFIGLVPAPLPWDIDPRAALPPIHAVKVVGLLVGLLAVTAITARTAGAAALDYVAATALVGLIAIIARVLNHQSDAHRLGIPDECVALGLGLVASRVVAFDNLRRHARPEPWLKLGVTVLGAEVLLPRMLALGVPGLVVIASVTPIVIVLVWFVGTRVLRMTASARLLLLSVATAVGGVSAVMMASVATRARKSELGFALAAVGAITFTLTHLLPWVATLLHLDAYVARAWLGGTLDSNGVRLAASTLSDPTATALADKLALVQHSTLSFLALVIAVYWLVHPTLDPRSRVTPSQRLGVPVPVVGMLLASVVSSFVLSRLLGSDAMQELVGVTSEVRGWCFSVAAAALGVSVGAQSITIEADRGRSLVLIAIGVTLDATLTLLLADQVLSRGLASGAP